ncbi:NLPA lipoprotein, partial [Acinetobacter baumannii]
MKKLISLFLSVSVVLLAACGKQQNEPQNGKDSAQLQTVVIASTGSDADIWRYIATLPETKAAGLKLEVKN